MKIELRRKLQSDAGLAALVGDRVDWLTRPRAGGLPAVTLQIVDRGRDLSHDGPDALQGALVQVDVWAADQASAEAAYLAFVAAIEPASISATAEFDRAIAESERDMPPERLDSGETAYRESGDFRVWWRPR